MRPQDVPELRTHLFSFCPDLWTNVSHSGSWTLEIPSPNLYYGKNPTPIVLGTLSRCVGQMGSPSLSLKKGSWLWHTGLGLLVGFWGTPWSVHSRYRGTTSLKKTKMLMAQGVKAHATKPNSLSSTPGPMQCGDLTLWTVLWLLQACCATHTHPHTYTRKQNI